MNSNSVVKVLIDIFVFIFIYFVFLYKKWKNKGMSVLISNTLMYIYFIGVMYFTLMPIITSFPSWSFHSYVPMNLNLFEDLFMQRGDCVRQIVLNVIMMIPFGVLLPICRKANGKNCTLIYTVLCTLFFSLSIEIVQPFIHSYSSSDITDVVTNTFGGFLGYICYSIFKSPIDKIFRI